MYQMKLKTLLFLAYLTVPALSLSASYNYDSSYCVEFLKLAPENNRCPFSVGKYHVTQIYDENIKRVRANIGSAEFIYDGLKSLPQQNELILERAWGTVAVGGKRPIKFSTTISREPRRSTDKYDKPAAGWVSIPLLNCKMQYVSAHACQK